MGHVAASNIVEVTGRREAVFNFIAGKNVGESSKGETIGKPEFKPTLLLNLLAVAVVVIKWWCQNLITGPAPVRWGSSSIPFRVMLGSFV